MTSPALRLGVVGSANVDVVVRCAVLPRPGETILASDPSRFPGGKAANQAAALAALGMDTTLIARVGFDEAGEWLIDNLEQRCVRTSMMQRGDVPTGTAFITVDETGENIIVVARGANAHLTVDQESLETFDVVLAQMEVDAAIVDAVAARAQKLILNVAPARPVSPETLARCAVVIANEHEAELLHLADLAHCVVTLGAMGAVHYAHGVEIARATPPPVAVVDTVGAGDVFCAAYAAQFAVGASPQDALTFAVTAGALATQALGAQGALPTREEVLACQSRA
jgi:ribokinase